MIWAHIGVQNSTFEFPMHNLHVSQSTDFDRRNISQEIADLLHGSDLYVYQGRVSQRPSAKWRQNVQEKSAPEKGHPRVLMMGDAIHAMMPSL